eukprot:5994294-Ditylum_brightwellii.AAC.1
MHHDQEKGHPPKDYPVLKVDRKNIPLSLVTPLNVLNHACAKHCNMTWNSVSGKRYTCTIKKVAKKGGQTIISYYFGEEDVKGE